MDLELLHSLVEAARRGSITAAAQGLGITQPALSRRLQLLEAEFASPLLTRSRKGVALTEPGRLVVEEGSAILERIERLKRTIGAHLRLERGAVRIGGGATAVSLILPEPIRRFRRDHGEIVFHLKEAGSREIEADVLREDLELGIVTLPAASKELHVQRLVRDPIVLIAATDHPLAARTRSLAPSALEGAPLIGFEEGSAIRNLIDRSLAQHGVRMEVVMELRSIPSIVRMVALQQGLAFVSRLGVEATAEPVVALKVRGLRIVRSLGIIRKRGRPLSLAAAAFLKTLR